MFSSLISNNVFTLYKNNWKKYLKLIENDYKFFNSQIPWEIFLVPSTPIELPL